MVASRIKGGIDAEEKTRSWIENMPLYLQLQWFDAFDEVKVASELHTKSWNTEGTARDRLYFEKLEMITD